MRRYFIIVLMVFAQKHSVSQVYRCIQEFRIEPAPSQLLWKSEIAATADSGFVVCWISETNINVPQIYGQRFNRFGQKYGDVFQVNTDQNGQNHEVSVAGFSKGGFITVWRYYPPLGRSGEIRGQLYNASGQKQNSEFVVFKNEMHNSNNPAVAVLKGDDFFVVWNSYRWDSLNYCISGQHFLNTGEKTGHIIQINTYRANYIGNPSIAALDAGGFVVSWESEDSTEGKNGLFLKTFNQNGIPTESEIRVYDNSTKHPVQSAISALSEGFAAVWIEGNMNFQIFDGDARRKTEPLALTVHDQVGIDGLKIAGSPDGRLAIVWASYHSDALYSRILFQPLSGLGERIGSVIWVSPYGNEFNGQYHPAVSGLKGGGFALCWKCGGEGNAKGPILGKIYNEKPFVRPLRSFSLIEPKNDTTLMNTGVLFRWEQPGHLKEFDPSEITFNLLLDTLPDFSYPIQIKGIQDTIFKTVDMMTPGETYFWKIKAINAADDSLWSSNTNAFFISYAATNAVKTEKIDHSSQFILYPNYPNPFNSETAIRFAMPMAGYIEISIYDISGKLIKVFIKESQTAGSHSVKWDGRDSAGSAVPSGIYICRMEVRSANGESFVQNVKMGLMK